MSEKRRASTFEEFSRRNKYRVLQNMKESSQPKNNDRNVNNVTTELEDMIRIFNNNSQNGDNFNHPPSINDCENDSYHTENEIESDSDVSVDNDNNREYVTDDDNESNYEGEYEESTISEDEPEDLPIYDGAPLTVGESLLAILIHSLRHNLTGVCLADTLELIELHCKTPNRCKSSLYLFKQYFSSIKTPLNRRFYCSSCFTHLKLDEVCQKCPSDSGVSYFVEIPILTQLQIFYKRPGFIHTLLNHRFNRNKQNNLNYEDIYDGKVYQELSHPPGILSNPRNISFMWNTDGVSLFKSSKYQIWPFYLSINELPYSQRLKKENLIIAGLWFGPSKPQPHLYLRSISTQLNELKNGVYLEVPNHNNLLRVQATVICGTCDLPAKALFLNMKQFNGDYGCHKCTIKTQAVDESNACTRYYPFRRHLQLRTQLQTNQFAIRANELGEDVYGVKGISAIHSFNTDYIRTTAIDSMHCVYLGVVKNLLTLWFSPIYSDRDWSLHQFVIIVDRKIKSMTPPAFISRLPRTITDDMARLKASELKTWFFYYSIPILNTIMRKNHLDHYKLFVYSIYLLNQSSIADESIDTANNLLIEFVNRFEYLYDVKFMTANLHSLLHLPEIVRDLGPLWVTSCFPYENANGLLTKLVNGTRFAESQICSGLSIFIQLPELKRTQLKENTPVFDFCERLTNKRKKYNCHNISTKIAIVGIFYKNNQLPIAVTEALRASRIFGTKILIFKRLIKSGFLYTSELYKRITKMDSKYVKYRYNNEIKFGVIFYFMKVSSCECKKFCKDECNAQYIAIIKECTVVQPFSAALGVNLAYIHRSTISNTILAINVNNLINVCFHVKILPEAISYIIEPVNLVEIE